jgi:hypothetical protein
MGEVELDMAFDKGALPYVEEYWFIPPSNPCPPYPYK